MLTPCRIVKSAGFTLVELMVAIVILGILAAVGLPSYRQYIQNLQIRNAAESIMSGLQLARAEAVGRNMPVRFTLDETGSGWTVCLLDVTATACTQELQNRKTGDGSSSAVALTPSLTRVYNFNGFGRISSPAAASSIDIDGTDSSLLALQVQIGTGGITRMCDRKVTTDGDPRKC